MSEYQLLNYRMVDISPPRPPTVYGGVFHASFITYASLKSPKRDASERSLMSFGGGGRQESSNSLNNGWG